MLGQAPPEWDELLEAQARPRPDVHVTDCLGCPRKKAGLRAGWAVDYSRLEARLRGRAIHLLMEEASPETAEVPVFGELFGLRLEGSIDRLRGAIVADYKSSSAKSRPTGAYPEHVWQVEAYRRLLQSRRPTTGWAIHYFWQFREWVSFEHSGPYWSDEELARFRPHGGTFTCKEIGELAREVEFGVPPANIPLVGRGQTMGKGMVCDYCEVEEACKSAGVSVEF